MKKMVERLLLLCGCLAVLLAAVSPEAGAYWREGTTPGTAEYYYQLGREYQTGRQEKPQEAITALEEAIRLDPDYYEAYIYLGSAYQSGVFKGELYPKAIEIYKKAIELRPELRKAYGYLAILYFNMGEYEKAIELNKKEIELEPKPSAYIMLGGSYRLTGRYQEAIEAYQIALTLEPKDRQIRSIHFALGLTYLALNDRAEAIKQCHILEDLESHEGKVLRMLIEEE